MLGKLRQTVTDMTPTKHRGVIPHGDRRNMKKPTVNNARQNITNTTKNVSSNTLLAHTNESKRTPKKESGRYLRKLKDYSLLMEYKKLKHLAPTGIYVVPSVDSLRHWHGVIFLRKSHYRKGIFKFVIRIPEEYPDASPRVFFTSKVFNPLINPRTGELDLSIQFATWNPNQHYIVLLLAYVKKIFYKVEFWNERPGYPPFNKEASELWKTDKTGFMSLCENSAQQSVEKVYVNGKEAPLRFAPREPGHEDCLKKIVGEQQGASSDRGEKLSFLSWFVPGVDKVPSIHTPKKR